MSLRLKTILGIALIEAVLLAMLITLTLDFLKTTNYEGLTKRGETTARLFASSVKDAVLSWDLASLESFTQELMSNPDIVYVEVIGENGSPLAKLGHDNLQGKSSPELTAEHVTDGVFDVAYPIQESEIKYGSVRIGLDMTYLNKQIDEAKKWSFFIVLGEMALVALFSYVLGAFLTKRLTLLEKAAEKLAKGRRDIQVDDSGSDEISHLAKAFNSMVTKLTNSENASQNYQQQLETLNSSLEDTVRERTVELKQNNEDLIDTNNKLKKTQGKLIQSEKMASIGTMAAGFAHEINNPIGSVDSNLQTIREYLDCYRNLVALQSNALSEIDEIKREKSIVSLKEWIDYQDMDFIEQDIGEALKDAITNTHRVRDIVLGLKSYSMYQKDSPQTESNLEEVLKQCCEQVKFEYPSSIKIDLKTPIRSVVLCNQTELKQAINAVLKNALQSMQGDSLEHVLVETQLVDQSVKIMVRDSGVGIAPKQLTQIFDPFFSSRNIGEGTGLGLTLAHNIVEQHKGSIEVESQLQRGTTITITLPKVFKHADASNHVSPLNELKTGTNAP
ncbi:HAMP domain-containing sensor histidine kinase [Vibrio penaeicida]|uniref:HAMP domain-containing sensor histidine kinase n=1 Tax=Vibrio penaeicida TaxID=104609 RepID=UPI000CEA6950|nr:ATP-binding protein [Vibrio penaeicida]